MGFTDKGILGCDIDFRAYPDVSSAIDSEIGKTMLLSDLGAVTGILPSTIQNWVKRGYISKPDGKKYTAEQAADIILLDNIKNSVELSDASVLLRGVKEKSGVSSVDLLKVLAASLIRAKRFNSTDRSSLQSVINIELRSFGKGDREVSSLIFIIALSALSADYKRLAREEIKSI